MQAAIRLLPKGKSGQVFIFRGRSGDLVKLIWFDGDGRCYGRIECNRSGVPRASGVCSSGAGRRGSVERSCQKNIGMSLDLKAMSAPKMSTKPDYHLYNCHMAVLQWALLTQERLQSLEWGLTFVRHSLGSWKENLDDSIE